MRNSRTILFGSLLFLLLLAGAAAFVVFRKHEGSPPSVAAAVAPKQWLFSEGTLAGRSRPERSLHAYPKNDLVQVDIRYRMENWLGRLVITDAVCNARFRPEGKWFVLMDEQDEVFYGTLDGRMFHVQPGPGAIEFLPLREEQRDQIMRAYHQRPAAED